MLQELRPVLAPLDADPEFADGGLEPGKHGMTAAPATSDTTTSPGSSAQSMRFFIFARHAEVEGR
jgi:hypothetical protein